MAGLIIEIQPKVEPVAIDDMKNFLRVDISDDDATIGVMITAARELCESFTRRSFVQKGYKQVLDSFPYFVDTVMSQLAFPPSYYSLPRYSTTLWNYSQMIKLFRPPLVSVNRITYVSASDQQKHDMLPIPQPWSPDTAYQVGQQITDPNDNIQTCSVAGTSFRNPPKFATGLTQVTTEPGSLVWVNNGPNPSDLSGTGSYGLFLYDAVSEPGRVFPGPPGQFWPPVLYIPNAVEIHYTAGYSADAALVPARLKMAIKQLVSHWYENREIVTPGNTAQLPFHVQALLWSLRIEDYQPTRG